MWDISPEKNKLDHPDPFIGSGTTALAAIKTGRRYIGFDVFEEYCEMARNRVKECISNL